MDGAGGQSSLVLEDLRNQIQNGHAVLVVGAGVSLGSTKMNELASWKGLLRSGCQRCEEVVAELPPRWGQRVREEIGSGDLDDLLSAAEKVSTKLTTQTGEYARWLSDTVGSLHLQDPEPIAALASLGVPIVTTNYDCLIEEVTGLPSITWREPVEAEKFIRGDESGVFHLHGCWKDSQSVILGIRSYENVLSNAPAQALLHALRTTKTLVFVGFGAGLSDPTFSALLNWARAAFSGSTYRHFRLACECDTGSGGIRHAAADRIFVVSYGRDHGQLAPFLRGLRPTRDFPTHRQHIHGNTPLTDPAKVNDTQLPHVAGPERTQPLDLSRPITVTQVRKQEKLDATVIANVAFHPDGHLMAFSLDNRLFLLPLHDVFPERLGVHENSQRARRVQPSTLPAGEAPSDMAAHEELLESKKGEAHSVRTTGVAFSPDGDVVASSDTDGYVKFWSLASRVCLAELSEHTDVVTGISFSPKGEFFASAGYDEVIYVWETRAVLLHRCDPFRTFVKKSKIKRAARFPHDIEQIVSITFSQNGKHLASGDQQGVIVGREILSGDEVFRQKVHNGMVNAIAFSPAVKGLLATASDDSRIRITDCYSGSSPITLGVKTDKHAGPVMSIAFSHTGDILVSSACDRRIKLWDVHGRRLLRTYPSEDDRPVEKVAFCPNRYDFATDSYDCNISLWGISNAGGITNTRIRVDASA